MPDTILPSNNRLLETILNALGWKGSARQIQEVKSIDAEMDLQSLRDTIANLGYLSEIITVKPGDLPASSYPLLRIADDQPAEILLSDEDIPQLPNRKCQFLIFYKASEQSQNLRASMSILRYEIKRFTPLLNQVFMISLIIGGLSLSPILYNRAVYDHLIASGSSNGFLMLLTGVLLALSAEIILRYMRNRKLAFFGGRLDHYVGCSVFQRLLFLPAVYTERSSTSSQLARLRDFESVRDFFTGPLSSLVFEFPMVIIYMIAMIIMSGPLALVPAVLIFAYAVLIFVMNIKLKTSSRLASALSTKRQEALLETITKLRDIRLAGLDDIWLNRYRQLSGQSSLASFKSSYNAQSLETISYGLMMLGGMCTLGFGVLLAINNQMTIGSLIAAMMLIWRIIAPLQMACASLTRIQQLSSSTKQVERLLSVAPERDMISASLRIPNLKGAIGFHRVSLKYSAEAEPALLGFTFEIKPGQIIAIKGNNGSGKSSLLKLVLGLYQPQGGSVRLDGVDIRQFDPLALRQSISYVPQNADFFPGTLRENFLFAYPQATEDDIIQALQDARAYDDVIALPNGLDTVIQLGNQPTIPFALRQNLNLARGYIRKSPIYLFDEASYALGLENDTAFEAKIKSLKNHSTVLMVTHREDHMQLADQLLVINKGELTHAGPPQQVLNVLKGKIAS